MDDVHLLHLGGLDRVLIMALSDNFRRHDHSGWAKALWTIFIVFLPLLGVLAYIITRPPAEESAVVRQ